MSNFQTQSQWENEMRPIEETALLEAKKGGVTVRKRTLIVLGAAATVIVLFLLCLYLFGRPVTGVWVRQMDDAGVAGMTIKVECVNGNLQGTIIAMDEGEGIFEVGQIKWAKIKKVGFGKYVCYDLVGIGGGSTYFHYDDSKTIITVLCGGKQLTVYHPAETWTGQRYSGVYQAWVRAERWD